MNAYTFIVNLKNYASNALNQIAASVGQTANNVRGLNNNLNQVQATSSSLSNTLTKLKSVIASVFALTAVWSFTNKVIEARSEYEKFNAVLINTFQSDKVGAAALTMLNDFAAKTPFALNELTGSFVKLVNRGVLPTQDELTKLGDLASSQGKGFDQLTEAMLDAQTGEFERLKEFGIKASKSGDMVKLSFKGVTKEVKNNSDAITDALLQYGQMKGVAGSMEAISQTLGGKISNLGDQWNTFLVAVGGESGEIFTGALTILSFGLAFLSDNLSYISEWFSILFEMIKPVVIALSEFLRVAFGVNDASNALGIFGNVMIGVLVVVNWLTVGLTTIIDILSPFAREIMVLTAAWWLWNNAIGIFNALMLVNPVTWIVLGIMALIMVIGMVTKYTSGWGESWKHTVNGAKFLWQTFTDSAKYQFTSVVNNLMIGIDKIKLGWYKFKEAVGMGDSTDNQKMIAQINGDVEARKRAITDGYKKMVDSASKAKNEFSQVGIKVDTNGIKKDFQALKDRFSNAGAQKKGGTSAYDDYLTKNKGLAAGARKDQDSKAKKDTIVSGGSKMTHITINIQKLQDDTKIFVESTEKGIESLGEKVQEMLLRAVNSVNQMQTD
ncbi:hypothetical protein NJT12_03310 [Flavobacterium sp. AC]|uniref:Tape measure domain-containing protein n=1 Tax=Flavobacterium azizsancarii TaxID=2961580 RepID=A0ABT4W7Y2_9FLAO|nr:hypothetical protein [Flavobacterium azizsancarii]MDA6068639.1 hypothetical protein [Flavobacterium azizsancarii]